MQASPYRPLRKQVEIKSCDDAKIIPAAAEGAIEVRVSRARDVDHAAVGKDNLPTKDQALSANVHLPVENITSGHGFHVARCPSRILGQYMSMSSTNLVVVNVVAGPTV